MNEKKIRIFVVVTAFIFLFAGAFLFFIFDRQGFVKKEASGYINYNINDYIEISPVVFNNYDDVYSGISVSRISFKNINYSLVEIFLTRQEEIIDYITDYYDEIRKSDTNYPAVSSVSSVIKTQLNGAVLSVFYQLNFNLDKKIYSDNIKSYSVTINIDLGTSKLLSNDDLLLKYNYSKKHIADKLFNEDLLLEKGQIVIDKDTNISLTKSDIERKKASYVNRIISEFDNIIDIYIENGSLVLVYDVSDLKNIFFDNRFENNIKFRYLK